MNRLGPLPRFDDAAILAARPPRNATDPWRPVAWLVEPECTAEGTVTDVATVFLTNRECPLRCLMCDLWKNTTEHTVPVGAIPAQIAFALEQLLPASHIKLYNSGNFFDPQAIPPQDYPPIAALCAQFASVIVENHPRFCGDRCLGFRDLLHAHNVQLEVALGLETIHPDVLPRLNKQMTAADFAHAAEYLVNHGIRVRAFVLLRPPFLDESEGIEWALKSIEFAFDAGASCCAVIPTRAGNGIMEQLAGGGWYAPPALASLEEVLDRGLRMGRGRVFVDLWDAARFTRCPACAEQRIERLRRMNLSQHAEPVVECPECNK